MERQHKIICVCVCFCWWDWQTASPHQFATHFIWEELHTITTLPSAQDMGCTHNKHGVLCVSVGSDRLFMSARPSFCTEELNTIHAQRKLFQVQLSFFSNSFCNVVETFKRWGDVNVYSVLGASPQSDHSVLLVF